MKLKHLFTIAILSVAGNALAQTQRGTNVFQMGTATNPEGETVVVDSRGLIIKGKPVIPVMGEIHYARVPETDWRREVQKMKAGGVTVLATYVFWIHHEDEVEGVWNWSGNRNLRKFIQICKEENLPVVLRVGPFCHGEVYQGGMPCWIVKKSQTDKNYKLRSTAPGFLEATANLYNQIGAQVNGLLWKDGGPIIGVQLENECRGPWAYFVELKKMALKAGLDVPFYTRTGWPQMSGQAEFGQILPLYGDYGDGFWDRVLTDMPGDYPKAFIMKSTRLSAVIATETFGNNQSTVMHKGDLSYPYLTCELGGGMMQSYHRRINMSGKEAMPLCVCKLGSGSNLPGYYMYHGGTNPLGTDHIMSETQASSVTNYNDLPIMSYDFQTILGEMGQPNPVSWNETRWVHQFLADWGEELSSMDVDSLSDHYAHRGQFIFRNDYVKILNEEGSASITPDAMKWEGLTITSNDVQPFAKADGGLYFITVPKTKKYQLTVNGKNYSAKLDKPLKIAGKTLTVLSPSKAKQAYVIDGKMCYTNGDGILLKEGDKIMQETWTTSDIKVPFTQTATEKTPRDIPMGSQKVAAEPVDADFDAAAVWTLDISALLPNTATEFYYLSVSYRGDCARIYADGVLVEDNYWNGKEMLVRASSLIGKKVELKILPLRKDAPIYLQKAQKSVLDSEPGSYMLHLDSIKVIKQSVTQY